MTQFCSDWDTKCSDAGIPQGWASADACVTQAQNFPTGLEGATGGNSLACRIVSIATPMTSPAEKRTSAEAAADTSHVVLYPPLTQYHLGVAQSAAPTRAHCGHASQSGEGVCVNNTVSAFCSRFIGTCGTSLGWSTSSACIQEVTGYIDGASGSVTGDTLGCRICKCHNVLSSVHVYGLRMEEELRMNDMLGTDRLPWSGSVQIIWVRRRQMRPLAVERTASTPRGAEEASAFPSRRLASSATILFGERVHRMLARLIIVADAKPTF